MWSRLVVWGVALVGLAVVGRDFSLWLSLDPSRLTEPFGSHAVNFALAPGGRWDSAWYLGIAKHGYGSSAQSTAFFPLYPLLVGGLALAVRSPLVAGMLLSAVCFAGGLTLLHRLALLDLEASAARLTVWLVALSPAALFFSAAYTESLYLMLSVGAVYAARLDRWAWAGVLGALASASRPSGVVLAVPLALIYLYGPRRGAMPALGLPWWRPRYPIRSSVLWLALVPAGVLAYMGYTWIEFGSPLEPYHAASLYWGRAFDGPFGAFFHALRELPRDVHRLLTGNTVPVDVTDPVSWTAHDLIDLAFFGFGVLGLWLARRRVPGAYSVYAVLLLLQAASFPSPKAPLMSLPRYELVIFPIFMGYAGWLAGRRVWRRVALVVSACLLGAFSWLWGIWAWVA